MRTILCIENDDVLQKLYSLALRRHGYHVILAGDAHAAMQLATKTNPDLILLELNLPVANGLDVLRWLKASPQLGETPVLVLSTYTVHHHLVQAALEVGADKYMSKTNLRLSKLPEILAELLPADAGEVSFGPAGAGYIETLSRAKRGR